MCIPYPLDLTVDYREKVEIDGWPNALGRAGLGGGGGGKLPNADPLPTCGRCLTLWGGGVETSVPDFFMTELCNTESRSVCLIEV